MALVVGSNPTTTTIYAPKAELEQHPASTRAFAGSNPVGGTKRSLKTAESVVGRYIKRANENLSDLTLYRYRPMVGHRTLTPIIKVQILIAVLRSRLTCVYGDSKLNYTSLI